MGCPSSFPGIELGFLCLHIVLLHRRGRLSAPEGFLHPASAILNPDRDKHTLTDKWISKAFGAAWGMDRGKVLSGSHFER